MYLTSRVQNDDTSSGSSDMADDVCNDVAVMSAVTRADDVAAQEESMGLSLEEKHR